MVIEVGHTYKDGAGTEHRIMGHAKCNPIDGERVFWSLDGFWYTETGKHVNYHKHGTGGEYRHCTCLGERSWRNLKSEA